MIQRFGEDDDGSTFIEADEEGLEHLIDGLRELLNSEPGVWLSTAAVWTVPAPWWKFWNRTGTPVVGEIRLRKVADPCS